MTLRVEMALQLGVCDTVQHNFRQEQVVLYIVVTNLPLSHQIDFDDIGAYQCPCDNLGLGNVLMCSCRTVQIQYLAEARLAEKCKSDWYSILRHKFGNRSEIPPAGKPNEDR